jgi:ATP diphosphatase
VVEQWEVIKARERESVGPPASVVDGVPRAMPALLRAHKLGKRAAAVGFDWARAADVFEKIREEVGELEEATRDERPTQERIEEELGDLLFAIANVARKLNVDPEAALARANDKFTGRFQTLECALAEAGRRPQDLSLAELEEEWTKAKRSRRER